MNCLHVLALNSKENSPQILDNLLKYCSTFPLDIQDEQGNTGLFKKKFLFLLINKKKFSLALLLAYKNGHGQLCRALVTAGANLSICNNDSISIFTIPTASKALLVNILGK